MSKIEISSQLKQLVQSTVEYLKNNTEYLGNENYLSRKEIKENNLVEGINVQDNIAIAKTIDHTLLKPEATKADIKKLCEEALQYNFASVCINSCYVKYSTEILKNTSVKVCTVIGFPLGATTTGSKKFEAEEALKNGAEEVDMVINIGRLKDRDVNYVYKDIKLISDSAKEHNGLCKVILETCLLTDEEKILACLIAKDAGADFVKTSTGFSKDGAKIHDVALMKYVVAPVLRVKASGGIRSKEDAIIMLENGASRLGTSSGVKIILGEKSESKY